MLCTFNSGPHNKRWFTFRKVPSDPSLILLNCSRNFNIMNQKLISFFPSFAMILKALFVSQSTDIAYHEDEQKTEI